MRTNEERLDSLERENRQMRALFLQVAEGSDGWLKPREAMELLGCKQRTLSRLRTPRESPRANLPSWRRSVYQAFETQ